MKTSITLLAALLAGLAPLAAQSNVRVHYASGQVWVKWEVEPQVLNSCVTNVTYAVSNNVVISITNCVPATYAIWFSTQPVTNLATAALVGRLLPQEWSASLLRAEIEESFGVKPTGFRIPDGAGGYRTLATNEGLFVHTVRSNFTGYYAVRPFGAVNVPAASRAGSVTATFSTNDPPTCHSQAAGQKKSYPIEWFTTWVDGDNDPNAGRPDFPLMANAAKRGVAHSFFVMQPKNGLTASNNIPASLALHSGDARAAMWLPGENGFDAVGCAPQDGYLVALEDRLAMLQNAAPDTVNTRWLGYVPSFDPFTDLIFYPFAPVPWTNNLPATNEIVQPYTLTRLNWTLDWLIAQRGVDPDRVSLMGHSGGSMGGLLWSRAFPARFSSVNLYGTGLGDYPNPFMHWKMHGTRDMNLPTTLTNFSGQTVHTLDLVQLTASLSPLRDTPFTRVFVGKREENWVMDDDRDYHGDVIANFRLADALGQGVATFWDLREHGVDGWTYQNLTNKLANPPNCSPNATVAISGNWSVTDLWVPTLTNQFMRDDVANQVRYRAAQSYPAFFNFQERGGHGGHGEVLYTNTVTMMPPVPYDVTAPYDGLVTAEDCYPPFTGDHRGTWGGYFDWETNIVDTPTNWQCVVFLVGANSAFVPLEICPDSTRVCDVALRRPQQFKPATGSMVAWELRDAVNNALFQSGSALVGADDLVSIPSLTIPRDPLRARLIISLPTPVVPPAPCPTPLLSIRQLTNGLIELSWPSCPSNSYQIEWTRSFQNWQWLTPPLGALPTNGVMTWTTPVVPPYQFFRLAVVPLTSSPVPTMPGVHPRRKLEHGGIVRNYRLNIPASYTGATPAPLALILHGHNQTADEFAANQPALAGFANAQGVILVFPDGTDDAQGTGWNILDPTPGNPVDDVGFLLALIDELDATLNIDRKRVYAGGFSNGGQMCHRLGARTTNVFAAMAMVGSGIAGDRGTGTLTYTDPPSEPLPVLIVNATNDCKRPFWGGVNEDGSLQAPAFDQVVHWTNGNFCAPSPVISTNRFVTNHVRRAHADSCAGPYPPFNAFVTNHVIREHYQLTCSPGSEVLFVTLTDGGHKWPEAGDNVGFDASREVLDFFLRHCRCDATGATETLVVPTAPGRYDLRLCDQGYSRLFRFQVPAGYAAANATPIVFAMHGGGQTMVEFASMHPALFAKCEAENVLLVLPEALYHPQSRDTLWMNKPFDYVVDDRVFFTNLLEHIAAALNVNRKRVYACGFSGGGSFSHWLAATTPGLLAAIAPVCTQTGWNEPDANGPIVAPPAPLEPIAVMMVRGTNDVERPFYGGTNDVGNFCRSAAEDVAYWNAGNLCVPPPTNTPTPYGANIRFANCAGTTEVVLIRIDGMPHLWPDAADGYGFDANVSVIDFLLRHTRP